MIRLIWAKTGTLSFGWLQQGLQRIGFMLFLSLLNSVCLATVFLFRRSIKPVQEPNGYENSALAIAAERKNA
jgi:hypothetical protein